MGPVAPYWLSSGLVGKGNGIGGGGSEGGDATEEVANGEKFTWKLTLSPVPGPAPEGPLVTPQKLLVASTSGVPLQVVSFGIVEQSAFTTPHIILPRMLLRLMCGVAPPATLTPTELLEIT